MSSPSARLGRQQAGACRQSGSRSIPARHLRRGARTRCISASRPGCRTGRGTSRSRPDRRPYREGLGPPDQGIWESRGRPRHFTHSKVMAWVGVDRYLKLKDSSPRRAGASKGCASGCIGPSATMASTRRATALCRPSTPPMLDASLLMLPLVGFLPIDDPRIAGTIAAIERDLVEDGLVRRRAQCRTAGRRRLYRLHLLARRLPRDARARPCGARLSRTRARACATMSVCCPRNGTRAGAACSATSRKR